MARWLVLVGVAAAGCGRIGFDLLPGRSVVADGGTDGHWNGTGGSDPVDSRDAAAGGSVSPSGDAGAVIDASGGSPPTGGPDAGLGGNGGEVAAGGTGGASSGSGGVDGSVPRTGGGGSGAGGLPAAGGAAGTGPGDSSACVPTAGGIEICDGRDNDCSGGVDEGNICPNRCETGTYGGHGYMFCRSSTEAWDDGRAACQAAGMDLVTIESAGENQFVFDWVNPNRAQAFLGGSDLTTEGEWRWVNGTVFWSGDTSGSAPAGAYTNWGAGQPDNYGTNMADGDCLYMSWTDDGFWSDTRCEQFYDWVCEAP